MKTLQLKISKTKIIYLMLIAFAITVTSCQKPHKPDKPQDANDENTRDSILQVSIENLKENNIISLDEAIEIRNRYIGQRIKPFKKQLKEMYGDDFEETKTVWFNIDTIRTYLDYLERKTDNAEGLQFYFSVSNNGDSENHQTFFIAPTKKNGKIQSGYTIVDGEEVLLNTKFEERYSVQKSPQKAGFFSINTSLQDDESLLLNRGGGSPPHGNN